jgi:hypothetical protein
MPLPEMALGSGEIDLDIVLGDVPEIPGWRQAGERLFGASGELRFGPASRARMLASHGRRLVVQIGAGVAHATVRPYVLGSGMGAVLHERSYLPLHASVVETEDGCVALMGHRGAGKSTLAAFIASTGGSAVADDICAVTFVNGQPVVSPNRQRFKLADDAAEHLGFVQDDAERLPGGKLSIALRTTTSDEPIPLRAIFVLGAASSSAIRRLTSVEALSALVEFTFRPRHVVALGIEREHLQRCIAAELSTPVFALSIVRDLARLGDAATLVALSSTARRVRSTLFPPFVDALQHDRVTGAAPS